jgi:hypothetical protein
LAEPGWIFAAAHGFTAFFRFPARWGFHPRIAYLFVSYSRRQMSNGFCFIFLGLFAGPILTDLFA